MATKVFVTLGWVTNINREKAKLQTPAQYRREWGFAASRMARTVFIKSAQVAVAMLFPNAPPRQLSVADETLLRNTYVLEL